MGKQRSAALAAHVATGNGTAVNITDGESLDVYVSGTFVGTVIVELSPDGTNWAPAPSGSLTAPGIVTVNNPTAKQVRARCSAFTSGTITCIVALRDDEIRG